MGKTIVKCIDDTEGVIIAGGTEHSGHPAIGNDLGDLAGIGSKGVSIVENIESALADCDVIIDFTTPDSSIKTLNAALNAGKSIIIGTTGFSTDQKEIIKESSRKNSMCVCTKHEYRC